MAPLSSDICVCVPARDEAVLLPTLFAALEAQTVGPRGFLLCLYLDGCIDGSEATVRRLAGEVEFGVVIGRRVTRDDANAGRARHAAMRLGQAHLRSETQGLLLTTDADSVPAPDWIAAVQRSLQQADVVAGRIVRDDAGGGELQTRLEAYYDRLYRHRRRIDPLAWEPDPLHHHTGGANLALRAPAYAALGGFAEHASGEDARLVDDAHRGGLRVRRDARVVVRTSSRLQGRAPEGLAAALRTQAREGAGAILVAHPDDEAWSYVRHAEARRAFDLGMTAAAATRLGTRLGKRPQHVAEFAARQPNAEAFATCIVPARPGGPRRVSLDEAEHRLAELERLLDTVAA